MDDIPNQPENFPKKGKKPDNFRFVAIGGQHIAATEPMKLELFYDVELGSFAIDAEAVGNTPLYHPYTGNEIPDETT